jgi:hypothetical protein
MKYIRTKDKILIAPGLYDNGCMVLCSNPPKYETRNAKNEWGCVEISEVIKIADTIEELCDEFVLEKNDYFEYMIFKLFTTAKALKIESVKNKEVKANIYGAIWTDKGLIYVAKMNDKGELELL